MPRWYYDSHHFEIFIRPIDRLLVAFLMTLSYWSYILPPLRLASNRSRYRFDSESISKHWITLLLLIFWCLWASNLLWWRRNSAATQTLYLRRYRFLVAVAMTDFEICWGWEWAATRWLSLYYRAYTKGHATFSCAYFSAILQPRYSWPAATKQNTLLLLLEAFHN